MGLYPDLTSGSNDSECLNFSKANALTGFETANDKFLKDMNERAKILLSATPVMKPPSNPFDMQPSSTSGRNPSPRTRSKRFSGIHSRQFAKMEPIDTHPSIKARSVAVPTSASKARQSSSINAATPITTPFAQRTSPTKREGEALESPTKRLRRTPNSRMNLKEQLDHKFDHRTELRPEPASKSLTKKPSMNTLPKHRAAAPSGLPRSATTTSISRIQQAPRVPSTTKKDTFPIIPDISSQPRRVVSDSLPSYARPTASSLKKSQSTQSLRPIDVEQLMNQLPSAPTEKHSPRTVRNLFGRLPRVPGMSRSTSTKSFRN